MAPSEFILMPALFLVALIAGLLPKFVTCDQAFYATTSADEINSENLLLMGLPTVEIAITTPNKYLADTKDKVSMFLIGVFSLSGPHTVGPFDFGMTVLTVKLDRVIGELKSIEFQTTGFDGWLLSDIKCRIGNRLYELKGERKWLDALNPQDEKLYGDPFEHNAEENYLELPSSSKVTLFVTNSIQLFTPSGIYDDW